MAGCGHYTSIPYEQNISLNVKLEFINISNNQFFKPGCLLFFFRVFDSLNPSKATHFDTFLTLRWYQLDAAGKNASNAKISLPIKNKVGYLV